MTYSTPGDRAARLLRAALGLSGPREPSSNDFESWLADAQRGRVIPLLHNTVEKTPTDLTDQQRQELRNAQISAMSAAVRLELMLLRAAADLDKFKISFAVVKGSATAHLDYEDPSLRQYGDIDVLVSPRDFEEALEILRQSGWSQGYRIPYGHEPFAHAVTMRRADRLELDVHQRVAHRALGLRIPTDELLARSTAFSVSNHELRSLAPGDRLIHAAVHDLSGRGPFKRLSSTADVLVLADQLRPSGTAVLAQAESWRVRRLVEQSIVNAYVAAALPLPELWRDAMSRRNTHRDRLMELAYLGSRRRPALEEVAHLRLMGGPRDVAPYLRGYFQPAPHDSTGTSPATLLAQLSYVWARLRDRRS